MVPHHAVDDEAKTGPAKKARVTASKDVLLVTPAGLVFGAVAQACVVRTLVSFLLRDMKIRINILPPDDRMRTNEFSAFQGPRIELIDITRFLAVWSSEPVNYPHASSSTSFLVNAGK